MNPKALALLQRQQVLLMRSTELRLALANDARVLEAPLDWADQALAAGRWLRANPQWTMAAALVLALWRPRRALRWGGRLWSGWRLWQRARHWLARMPTKA